MAVSLNVRLTGADQTLRALAILEPSVARRVQKEISSIGTDLAGHISSLAQTQPPVSGWVGTPSWPAWTPVTGTSRRRGAGVVVTPTSSDARIASMYEYIGNATRIKTPQGATLSRMFNERLGTPVSNSRRKRPGRLVRPTLNERYGEARRKIEQACDDAVAEVNRRMP